MTGTQDLNDMMIFLAVIDAGSFTLASERLNIPKANLSRKVSRLEKDLGVTLLERTTRSQRLTEAGQNYLAHCRRIYDEIDLANASISQILNHAKGQLRVGTSVGIGQDILKPVIGQFMHQYPDIEMQLSLMNRRVDLIEEGFDMLIRVGQLEDSRLMAKRLGSIKRKIYVSPKYLEEHGNINKVSDLEKCDFLLMSAMQSSGKFSLFSGQKSKEFNIKPKLLVDDFMIVKQAVIDGLGVSIIPNYMCTEEIKNGKLVNILPSWGLHDVDAYALYPKHRLNIPKVQVFLDYILEVFKQRLNE